MDPRLMAPGGAAYQEKLNGLFGSRVYAYFPLWEPNGSTLTEIKNGYNGTYTAATLGQTGIGDGRTAPLFDGSTSYGSIENTTFLANFPGTEGSALLWLKVADAAFWTEGIARRGFTVSAVSTNYVRFRHSTTNNQISCTYLAGGVTSNVNITISTTAWFQLIMTWSKTADQVKAYLNGAQTGSTQTGLGVWGGGMTIGKIGAGSSTPSEPWRGYLAHLVILNAAMTASEAAEAARVP